MTDSPRRESARQPARILIVDDHPVIRKGLRDLLDDLPEFEVCGEAATGEQALAIIAARKPDVVVMDISLREGHGIELIKQLTPIHPEVRILVFSMHDEAIFGERAILAGAAGYIEKRADTSELIAALRDIVAGRIHLSSDLTERLLQHRLHVGNKPQTAAPHRLTDRELEVFEHIGHGRTTREIASMLNLSIKTVETHCENIKVKLGVENRIQLLQQAVHWVIQQG